MLSTFFSNFGRPWLKTLPPIPDQKANSDDLNNPIEDKDQEAAESEDKEVAKYQMSPGGTEEEVLNHESEKPGVSLLTAVEIEVEQPEGTSPMPGETTILGTENEVPVDLETNAIEQEVSLPETEATKINANSEELVSENDSLLPPELPVQDSTEVIEVVKDEAEPEEEVKETALSSDMKVAETEVNSSEAAVKNQLLENVRETVVLEGVAIEEKKEPVVEIQLSNSEAGNLEVLEAKMETLVAEMVNLAEEGPRESSGNIEAVQDAEIVKEVAAAIEGTVKGQGEVTVDVTSLTENDNKRKSADDPILHPAKESGTKQIEEALVTSEPIPVLEEEISLKAHVQEGPTNPMEEASFALAITTDTDGKEEDQLAFVQPQIVKISDELKQSPSKQEGKQSETAVNNLDEDKKVASAEIELSRSADLVNSTEIFDVRTEEELAEVNAVLRKYGVKVKRKDDSEYQGNVIVKITKQK